VSAKETLNSRKIYYAMLSQYCASSTILCIVADALALYVTLLSSDVPLYNM